MGAWLLASRTPVDPSEEPTRALGVAMRLADLLVDPHADVRLEVPPQLDGCCAPFTWLQSSGGSSPYSSACSRRASAASSASGL